MKNKIKKLFNPCTGKNIPVCKKSYNERTIKLIKPAALGTISKNFLEESTAPKLWDTRQNFSWYTKEQFERNTVIKYQNIEDINKAYFINKDYIDNLYESEKLKNIYKINKTDGQETISYNIEGKCYNPNSNDINCCNNNGNFNFETQKCECFNGWQGESCNRCGLKTCQSKV